MLVRQYSKPLAGVVVATALFAGSSVASAATIAHWEFSEGSGQTAASVGDPGSLYKMTLGASGSTASDPIWTIGRAGAGGALKFVNEKTNSEGDRDFLINHTGVVPTSNVNGLQLTNFTVEAWINLSSLSSGFSNEDPYTIMHLTGKSGATSRTNFALRANGNKLEGFYSDTGGTTRVITHTLADLKADEWMHVAFGRDSTTNQSKLWINGIERVSTETNDPISGLSDLKFAIGADITSSGARRRSFDGLIDDVRISDQLLTTGELLIPEPASLGLLGLSMLMLPRRRK
ncbi:LamG domain-containing protein [Poriferisphaera sp. WC338]|uniref:LamG domain-containing protein n=1 Tax=Poriferisphaera sp. WC338 TaxID=3425129 RepID=UPI003D819156